MQLRRFSLAVVLLLALCGWLGASDRKFIKQSAGNRAGLPFSDGVLVGNTLYIAGHIGLDAKTGAPPTSAEDEARMVMDSVKDTVGSAGLTMDDLVAVQIFCTDLKLYEAFNNVYKTYFHKDYPARAFIGVDKLVRNGRFEVTGIAIRQAQ
jgi:2-iminobutanoate/2-iminopropanoate deaminase